MAERFIVPTISNAAIDLPAILRAEVAAAFREMEEVEQSTALQLWALDYLTARYGPAPETATKPDRTCHQCHKEYRSGTLNSGEWYVCAECNRRQPTVHPHTEAERQQFTQEPTPTFTREAEAFLVTLAEKFKEECGIYDFTRAARAYLASREGR